MTTARLPGTGLSRTTPLPEAPLQSILSVLGPATPLRSTLGLAGPASPLQTAGTPRQMVVLLFFLGFVVSIVLSVTILVKGVQSYRRTHDPALLGMAAGILLLSGVPLLLNLILGNTTNASTGMIRLLTDLTRLSGLGLILFVIYRTTR